jgi:NADPH:quinone reductase
VRAVLCKEHGPPESLVVEEVASPTASAGQVVVSVRACGVNFPDTLIIEGKYQFKPPLPFSPGSEVAGIVKEVGSDVDHVRVGDRVIASSPFGGYAEEVAASASAVTPIPEGMDFDVAASVVMTFGTCIHALQDRANIQPGERLLVLGAAGGIGLAAVELGKLLGAHVIAAASSDEKLAVCREYGADETINYRTDDLKERVKALTGGQGVDVVIDPVGGEYAEAALRGMAWNGRYLVIGFTAGEIPRIPLNLPLLKGCAIVGVFWGSFVAREPDRNRKHITQLMDWIVSGRLRSRISARYPLEGAADALHAIIDRIVTGKVILVPSPR